RSRAGPGRGDDVVPAGVADPGQRVVFGHDGDAWPRPGAGNGGAKCRRQPAHAALDTEAALGEKFGEPAVRLLLFEAQLGLGVDLQRQTFEVVGEGLDGLDDAGLRVLDAAHPCWNSCFTRASRPRSPSRSTAVIAITLAAVTSP